VLTADVKANELGIDNMPVRKGVCVREFEREFDADSGAERGAAKVPWVALANSRPVAICGNRDGAFGMPEDEATRSDRASIRPSDSMSVRGVRRPANDLRWDVCNANRRSKAARFSAMRVWIFTSPSKSSASSP
jgi:hypothetical protein